MTLRSLHLKFLVWYFSFLVVLFGFRHSKVDENHHSFSFQEHDTLVRVVSGFRSLGRAVKLAPGLWSAMLIRMVVKPEFQKFAFDTSSALISHFKYHLPVSFWMCISRLLHRVVDKDKDEVL